MKFLQVRCNNRIDPVGVSADPIFSWKYEGVTSQKSYRIVVREKDRTVWDSGVVKSGKTCGIEYAGEKLSPRTEYSYTVTAQCDGQTLESERQTFETALTEGFTARWLSYPSNWAGYALYARNIKHLKAAPVRARMYIAGIGYYEAYVNGKKIGKSLLNPGATDYSKHILYDALDVTDMYREGDNITAVLLGNGWFGCQKFVCEIYFDFADGSTDKIETNAQMDWFSIGSPIVRQSIYGGETYDARREELVDGWDGNFSHINYFETGWMFSVYADEPSGALVLQENEPIEVLRTISPIAVSSLGIHKKIYDFGEIFAGRLSIRVRGDRGAKVTMRHAEMLTSDGELDTLNLRSAQATDEYILKGGQAEEYAPRFTYHGFRYAELAVEGDAEILEVVGEQLGNACPKIGEFHCSDEVINKLHDNAVRTESSNMHSIPTDCPQRDERFGWLNDLTSRLDQALMNFDVSLFYEKFVRDITDTQDGRGAVADTAPYKTGSRPADPVIVSYLLIPYQLYLRYGNKRVVRREYAGCKAWVDYLIGISENNLLRYGIYGDWAPPEAYAIPGTPCNSICEPHVISGAYLYWYCKLLSKLARIIGRNKDGTYYANKAEEVKKAYNKEYFDYDKGIYRNATQSGNSVPLALGLCPEEHREKVAAFVVQDVKEHDYHLTTGNQAYKHMLESLSDMGYAADMLRMVTNPTYPGWGYMIARGATSIWERWEAEMASEMNSFCHPMHGSIDAWFYGYLAGIRFAHDCVGGDKLVIKPTLAGLAHVAASVETVRGKVSVSYKAMANTAEFDITVPSCTVARFIAPLPLVSVNGKARKGTNLKLTTGTYHVVCADNKIAGSKPKA